MSLPHEETPVLFRATLRLDRLPRAGVSDLYEPDEQERKAAARLLDLVALPELRFTYSLTPRGARKWRLEGVLQARVVQSCVVTLEPVETAIEESLSAEFWPVEDLSRDESRQGGQDLDIAPDGPEPVENGVLALGQFVYETLASSIDPYPRAPGAELPREYAASGPSGEKPGPFAALQKLTRD